MRELFTEITDKSDNAKYYCTITAPTNTFYLNYRNVTNKLVQNNALKVSLWITTRVTI